jgi:4-amino-4-deoxy-L-arabinose transferase-like glycosyltransferase
MKFLKNKKLFLALAAALFIFSRIPTLLYPVDSDHNIYFYIGGQIAEGKTLYVDMWDHKPPLAFMINALMSIVFGPNLVLHRIFLSLLAILGIIIFYKLAKLFLERLKSPPKNPELPARLTTLLYILLSNLSQFTSSGNNTENLANIFILLNYYLYLKHRSLTFQRPSLEITLSKDGLWLLIIGLCLSCLVFLKPTFALLATPILIDILLTKTALKTKIKQFALLAVFPILQTAFWIIYFIAKNALRDFYIATFEFNSKYSATAWGGDLSDTMKFLIILAPFFLLYALALFPYLRPKALKSSLRSPTIRFLLLAAAASLLLALAPGSFYPYYFLPSIMPLSILLTWRETAPRKSKIKILAIALCLLACLAFSYRNLASSLSGPVKSQATADQKVADYIKAHTEKTDTIIAYVYGATFYELTSRASGSRFISASHLLLDYRNAFGYNFDQIFMSDLEKSRPKYLIMLESRDPKINFYVENTPVMTYFDSHFALETTIPPYAILKNNY